MAKNIILLSDGTGNSAAKVWRTNVWRLFQALDLTTSTQIATYDDGVGTSSFKPMAILGGAFGFGLKRNVIGLYKFACRNYQAGDSLYGFGFSRGAFTIRIVAGLILNQGLANYRDEAELDRKARAAYRAYRHEKYKGFNLQYPLRALLVRLDKRFYKPRQRMVAAFDFLGVWDTVAAYGLPVDEMTRGVDEWIWPLELPNTDFNPGITKARHAIAIDEERATFRPVLWDENPSNTKPAGTTRSTNDEQLLQVWFTGVHSNVGGGYPDDALANVSLTWMMAEAQNAGLVFKEMHNAEPDALLSVASSKDKDGRLYDSRSGVGSYYRYNPRKIVDFYLPMAAKAGISNEKYLPKIHESVFGRLKLGAHFYAPIGLPENYEVVSNNTILVNYGVVPPVVQAQGASISANATPISEGSPSKQRHAAQESIWDLVWRKRVIYFCTVFATGYLLLYPLIRATYPYEEVFTRLRIVSDTIRLVGAIVPKFFERWVDTYAHEPGWFLVCCSVVGLLTVSGMRLSDTVKNNMRVIWERSLATANTAQVSAGGPGPVKIAGYAVLILLAAFPFLYTHLLAFTSADKSELVNRILSGLYAYTSAPIWVFLVVYLFAKLMPARAVRALRTSPAYQGTLNFLKAQVLPFASAVAIVILFFGLLGHYVFSVADSFGLVCKPNVRLAVDAPKGFVREGEKDVRHFAFDISNEASGNCISTGVHLIAGKQYRVGIVRDGSNWTFFGKPSFMGAQPLSQLKWYEKIVMIAMLPLRRIWDRDWNAVVLRIGSTGSEEDYFDRPPPPPSDAYFPGQGDKPSGGPESFGEKLIAKRDGELFIYVNKPVLGSRIVEPTGKAKVTISEPF